ncbi:pilin N-terminal domain-containing protein [Faecalicatena contorta]|uniref:pilin N-terminal domain-containing protein n=1 Tax=Faecalicatena contorta TaxID=39482 RepID=UPI0031D46B91
MKSVRLLFPLLLTLILNLSLPVFASQNISLPENVSEVNTQKTGSIEIELTDGEEGTSKEGVIFHYSKVAEIVDGQYELIDPYKGSGIDLNAIEYAEELDEAAEKLSYYKALDGICKTNANGIAQMKNLQTGVYLLYVADQKNYEEITPVLIAVPTWGEQEGTMLYDVKVYPKHTPLSKDTETPKSETIKPVKTGDSQDVSGLVVSIGLAAGIVVGIILWKKRK